jgi:uncharacterized integral membrane protein
MPAERRYVGWKLWLSWVLLSGIGVALGLAGGFAVGFAIRGAISGVASQSVFGAVFGASVGTVQWLVLRRQVSRAGWWVLATTLGMGVGFALVRAMTSTVSKMVGGGPMYGLVNGALVGTLIGAMQWLVLRWQVSRAGWWVLASALGMAVGSALGQVAGQLAGVAMTGIALVWLLRQPGQETQ